MSLQERMKTLVSQESVSKAESQTFRAQDVGPEQSLGGVWSQERRHGAVKMKTRWVSIFGCYVGFSQSSRDNHTWHTHKMWKVPNFTFLHFAVLNPYLSVSSFHLCLMLVILFFLQPVKRPLGQVWKLITGFTWLDEWPNQQISRVGFFIVPSP